MMLLGKSLELKNAFTLNGWPPVASHLVVFFLGVGITNLAASGYEELPKLSPDALIVKLELILEPAQSSHELLVGDKIFVGLKKVTEDQNKTYCVFHERPVKLVSIESQTSQNLVLIPMKWLYDSVLPEQKSRKSKLYGFLPKMAKELPACESKIPRVLYGDGR